MYHGNHKSPSHRFGSAAVHFPPGVPLLEDRRRGRETLWKPMKACEEHHQGEPKGGSLVGGNWQRSVFINLVPCSHGGMPGRGRGFPMCVYWRERGGGGFVGTLQRKGGNGLGLLGFSGGRRQRRRDPSYRRDERDFCLRYVFRILLCCLLVVVV